MDDVSTDRYAGTNRYGTAGAVAGQDDFAAATVAILATGETFPDALAASGLAGANAPAPIVLTQSNAYTAEAQEALAALDSLTDVLIVGGTAAISDDVADDVAADGYNVDRIAGDDRYETAAEIAAAMATIGEVDGLVTALVATGTGFADALAGGPLAYASDLPILLTTPTDLPAATEAALGDLGIEQAIILGGSAAVSEDVEDEIDAITGNPSIRAAGENRFGTAAAVGELEIAELGWGPTEVLLANGLNFPDALSGGPLGGERNAPIILTASLPEESAEFLDDHSDTIDTISVLGGTAAVDEETVDSAEESAETTDNDGPAVDENDTVTTRPELVSATITETRTAAASTATRPPGTYVAYCFDEAITGAAIDATQYFVYNNDGTRTAGTGTSAPAGQTFTSGVMSTDNKCAEVIFPAFNTATLASTLTLATVNNGAATGGGTADTNIEGDAPLTPAGSSSSAAAAGVTSAPDLVSVGNFKAGPSADVTSVDFTFDAAAFTQVVSGFRITAVSQQTAPVQQEFACNGPANSDTTTASGQAAPGGNGTVTITVNCPEPTNSVQWDATNVARGSVLTGTVGSTQGGANPNPTQSAPVANSGNSDSPDLVLVAFSPDALANFDVVGYVYDENIQGNAVQGGTSRMSAADFRIYTTTGAETNSVGASRSTDPGGLSTAIALFADGTLSAATYVGGSSQNGAVTEADGTKVSGTDEEGATPSSGPTAATSGRTDGPDLTDVAIAAVTSAFGTTSYTVTYTFDEDTADTGTVAGPTTNAAGGNSSAGEDVILNLLHLYTSDGIDLTCSAVSGSATGVVTNTTALTNRTEDTDHQVVCSAFTVGAGGTAATQTQIHSGVVGTVDYGAVDDEVAGGDTSPEGADVASGSAGTPAS